ncbi:MAG: phosphotransferase [Myxococcota bacterium]
MIPADIREAWDLRGPAEPQSSYANSVWRVGDLAVRLSTSRRPEEVAAELDFVQHVGRSVAVALPRPSLDGRLVVEVSGGVACAFEWVDGSKVSVLTPPIIRAWGAHLAGLHTAGEGWRGRRDHWRLDRWWNLDLIDREDRELLHIAQALLSEIPTGDEIPCHADHGPQNFHWDTNRIISFDFDNLVYQPIGLDLAVPWSVLAKEADPQAAWAQFDAGYRSIRPMEASLRDDRALWLRRSWLYVLLSRLDLWPEPTPEQRMLIERYRARVLG